MIIQLMIIECSVCQERKETEEQIGFFEGHVRPMSVGPPDGWRFIEDLHICPKHYVHVQITEAVP